MELAKTLKSIAQREGDEKLISLLTLFCRVSPGTASEWVRDIRTPSGENLLKLMVFLDLCGYQPHNWKLHPSHGLAAHGIAFGLFTVSELQAVLDLERDRPIYRVLKGDQDTFSTDREKVLTQYVERDDFQRRLLDSQSQWQSLNGRNISREQCLVLDTETEQNSAKTVETLGALIKEAIPLAEYVVSDECSSEDRERLRQIAGKDGVFRLKNILARLTGERARQTLPIKQQAISNKENE